MLTTAPHNAQDTATAPVLFLVFARREQSWTLGCTIGHGHKPRERTIAARDPKRLREEVGHAKARFGVPETARVVSGSEAGRAGLWRHRFLQAQRITNSVVDSSSLAVNRRQRRAKREALDVRTFLTMRMRDEPGERQVWHGVNVPAVEGEEQRPLHHDLETLKRERTRTSNRIKGLLSPQGVRLVSVNKLPEQLEALRRWDGSPVPRGLRQRLLRVYAHSTFLGQPRAALAAERRAIVRTVQEAPIDTVRQLMPRKGIGINGAWGLVMACFGWRGLQNRRQVGS